MFSRDHWNSSSQKIYMPLGINCTSVTSIPTSVASSNPTTHIYVRTELQRVDVSSIKQHTKTFMEIIFFAIVVHEENIF